MSLGQGEFILPAGLYFCFSMGTAGNRPCRPPGFFCAGFLTSCFLTLAVAQPHSGASDFSDRQAAS